MFSRFTLIVAGIVFGAACSADSMLQPSLAGMIARGTQALATSTWETRASRPTPSGYGAAVVHAGKVLSFGGFHPHIGEDATLQIYDPLTDSWTSGAAPMQRTSWPVAVSGGKVYLFGGWNGSAESSNTEVYDLTSGTWSQAAPIPRAHLLGAAAEIGGRIIVAAGAGNFSGPPSHTDIYDPITNTWTQGAPIPQARSAVGGAAIGGKLYVAGGAITGGTRVGTLDVYDAASDSWATKTPMPTPRAAPGVIAIDGKLWVVGGSTNAGGMTDIIEIYDPSTDTWSSGMSMPTSRQAAQMAHVGNAIHAIAGHSPTAGLVVNEALVTVEDPPPPPPANPASKAECKNDGWVAFGFRNQGQCIRYVETGKDSR